jgi:hypothetical protein
MKRTRKGPHFMGLMISLYLATAHRGREVRQSYLMKSATVSAARTCAVVALTWCAQEICTEYYVSNGSFLLAEHGWVEIGKMIGYFQGGEPSTGEVCRGKKWGNMRGWSSRLGDRVEPREMTNHTACWEITVQVQISLLIGKFLTLSV